ncbi:hypothetical protein JL475_35830 [Streptomyces sp. M2CJ-2]|uniref:hypothetical protein n=1 Tax=Streptomyces sp. M2CJ-2 TaxID=2803948 RepID=UPI001927213C|nr:hypothetical protein [Streptomyces sp. M2CJ-2]MBL3671199.1 hypothetical protein [Streptomyces sp. M2CJ-2]
MGESGAPAGDAEGPAPGEGAEPKDDVRIEACAVDAATGKPSMEITVTNSAAWRVAYQLDIAFVTPVRVSFGDHGLATSPLEPGQSITTTADGILPLGGHVTCKVTQVTRTPR